MTSATSAGNPVQSDALAAGGIRLEVDGAVATVVLDRADRRNAMTPTMWLALAAVPELLPAGVRVVVIRGDGPTFCAGLDLRLASPEGVPGEGSMGSIMTPLDDQGIADQVGIWQQGFLWMRDPRWITIASVQGAAVGGGFQLALSADLMVAADDAKFCMKENALGLVPDLTGTKPLVDRVGYSRALEICATSRWIDADEAGRLGIAQQVVPVADLETATAALVSALLATVPAPGVKVKELLLAADRRDVHEQARAERETQVSLLRGMANRISGA
ncbi:enoyl-CoA hydratase/isomerase family protein [Sporichthya polymorpha]|uniref:enoyl-CoA hydratase/isomerase family protein n=1 Tax=Sporichthya polymorpha TaxID=35751 RepID=UPI000684D239|nr:enoyl-CoA hydratase/isomerase family protein [Sporichthya polymorpha]